MFKRYTYLNLFIAVNCFCFAQDLKQDVLSINKAYDNAKQLMFDIEIQMFESYSSQKIYYTEHGSIKKYGDKSLQVFDKTECLTTPDYAIIVDNEDKFVSYTPKKTTFKENDIALMLDLDSVNLFCKSYKYTKISDNTASYNFAMKDGYPDYNQIVLFFNSKTFFIEKIIFFCEEDDISVHNEDEKYARARVEINYKNIKADPKFNENDFSFQKYLNKQGKNFVLNENYKNYELSVIKL